MTSPGMRAVERLAAKQEKAAAEIGGPGIVLPHDSLCCARGRDERQGGRTYVVHDSGTRTWGWTVLADGTITDRWGPLP